MDAPFDPDSPRTPEQVLTAIEHTLENATFKLGRLRQRNRGSTIARDLTSVFYDVTAARHDAAKLLEALQSGEDEV